MANIAISGLPPIGTNLYLDSKMFLNDLTEQEIANVLGGLHIHIEMGGVVLLCIEGKH